MARTKAERHRNKRRRAEAAGRLAETATVLLYMCFGFWPLARRMRTPVGELDLVARRGNVLAIVEVKLRDTTANAAAIVSARNQRRVIDATRWWLAHNPAHVRYTIRFDVVAWAPWSLPRRIVGAFETDR